MMELIKLDGNFQPQSVIEGYSNLIWSERYATAGDFELHTDRIPETISELPLDSFVSLRDSTVPMVAETYEISIPNGDSPTLIVRGQTFDSYALSKRVSARTLAYAASGDGITKDTWVIDSSPSDAAFTAIRTVIGDGDQYLGDTKVLDAIAPAVSSLDAIPEIKLILPADYNTGSTVQSEIALGKLYDLVTGLISTNYHGIKAVRPIDPTSNQVGIEIYNGRDLTSYTVFDIRLNMFSDSSYLMSTADAANVGYVYGSNAAEIVLKTAAAEPFGLARSVILVDASSDTSSNTSAARQTRGLVELYNHNNVSLFDGTILDKLGSKYNMSPNVGGYALGDIVKLAGDYGSVQNARVVEFIRTESSDGYRAYPTLEALPPE